MRDFIDSRVVGGRQQIRAGITFHAPGERILWPYAYADAAPPRMAADDHDTFVAMGRAMARTNGYVALQSSTLYPSDGDAADWAYGRHRIFMFTFEMSPASGDGFYPPDEAIPAATQRNTDAVLYLLDQAGCPWRSIGKAHAHCSAAAPSRGSVPTRSWIPRS